MYSYSDLKVIMPEFTNEYEKNPNGFRMAFLRLALGAKPEKPERLRFEGNLYNPINSRGAVDVTRKSRFGNPYKVGDHYTLSEALINYEKDLILGKLPYSITDLKTLLSGKDLICWCKINEPCHGDIIISYANN